jgi:hypothetical protein
MFVLGMSGFLLSSLRFQNEKTSVVTVPSIVPLQVAKGRTNQLSGVHAARRLSMTAVH